MFRKIAYILFLFVFMIIGVLSFAQEQTDSSVKTEVVSTKEGYVSLDFRDASIKNVLEILALKSGVNIVASPEVKGMISLRLNDVPWQDALDVILQTYGYAYEKRGNIILVSSVGELKKRRADNVVLAEQEPLVTRTFSLSFAKASKAIESIQKMKSERGSVNFDERTNTLIITDIGRKIDLMENVIKKLDMTTPLISIEAKIVKTSFDDQENLGINWTNTITAYGAARPIVFPFDKSGQATTSISAPDAFPGADTSKTSNKQFAYGTLDFTSLKAVFDFLK
nr:secretin and TonB N-terminal domain-containing protein [Candidatus Omnitrophota bacterium]